MIIRKFRAATMREAMYKVKNELGEDAIILKSEKVANGGVFDFSETKYEYEITAALDKLPLKKDLGNLKRTATVSKIAGETPKANKAPNLDRNPADDKFKFIDLKTDLKNIGSKLDNMANHIKYNEMPNLPSTLVPYYIRMKNNFVEEKIIKDIMMKIYMDFKGEEFNDKNLIEKAVINLIKKKLNTAPLEEANAEKMVGPKVIALVGPTGVGKTTTLAKLAFNDKFFGKKKVGLITADTYRVAAVEQLKTYSNITQIPLEVIYQPDQIRYALRKFENFDVVLVDTAGRSQRNLQQMSELKKILYHGGIIDTYLVLSITTRNEDQADILKRFSAVNFNRIIFTKLDETSGFGGLLNSSSNYNVPISVITYGQNVPDDIDLADKDKISKMILWPEKVEFS